MTQVDLRLPGQPWRTLSLGDGEVCVGRWEGCEVRVADDVKQVSKRHVLLLPGGRVRDLGSKNGTTLNGARLEGEAPLGPGDLLVLGGVVELRIGGVDGPPATEDVTTWVRGQLARLKWARSEREQLQALVDAARTQVDGEVWALAWEGEPSAARYRHLVRGGSAGQVPSPRALSRSVVGVAVRRGRPFWTEDATTDPGLKQAHSVVALGLRAVGCVPVGPHAALYVAAGEIGDAARERLEALGAWAGALLEPPPATGTATVVERTLPGWVGSSPAMRALAEELATWAPLPFHVLLLGERGTGKTQAARVLHDLSGTKAPFVHVDCPSHVRGDTAASALFGHEKGAFTGADARKIGFLEEVGEGTLFLDEVGEIPTDLQALLLLALQERRFRRVGGTQDLEFRGRVVAATNQPIDAPGSTFRRDLFDRFAEVQIRLPPLREHREDVPALAEHFLDLESDRIRRPGLALPRGFSREALAVLAGSELSGNAREVQNAVRRALGLSLREGARRIEAHHLRGASAAPAEDDADPEDTGPYWEQVAAFERRLLAKALDEAGGNQTRAAERLGLTKQAWHRARKRAGLDV